MNNVNSIIYKKGATMIKEGEYLPDLELKIIQKGEIKDAKLSNTFIDKTTSLEKNKKIVLFSLPGAFTPTCSAKHLPGFINNFSSFKEKNVDEIVCLSVNDPFVMHAWGAANNALNDLTFIADGNANLSKALELTFDGSKYSLGIRGQRFAMILEGLKVKSLFLEEPGAFDVSSAENVLKSL